MRVGEGAAPATILVVEDERATRAALAYVLKRAGFAVREAESAAEAVSRLEDRPDLILLDVGLPDADGYAFCRRLKDDPATASVPVLLLSGLGARSEERVHGFDCGADGYLAKPAEKAELVAQVKALLRLRRVEESLRESERRYRELFDANPQPMWVTELGSMRFLAVNAAAIAKYGYPREEFLALTAADIRPSEDVPALLQSMKSPSVSMQSRGVWRHRMKDGSIREVEVSTRDVDYDGRAARLVLAVDVTEKRRAEQALREARAAAERGLARLRTVVGSMADGLVVADRHGELVEWNPAALHMHGFSGIDEARRHFTSLDEIFALSTPEGKPVTISDWPIARILRGEVVSDCELRVRRLDTGTERMIRYGGAPVRDPDGAIDLAVLNLHDVTERRRAEEELRCTAQLLRAVADGTTDAVFVKDLDGRYLLFNQAAGKFVGRDANAVLGKDDTTLFDAASAARIKERDRRVMASGEAETAEEVLTAAGVTRTYLATKAPYRDERGTIVGLIGISHDITYRKKAENKFRGLLECAPEAMVIVNQDGAIVLVNARTEQLFGYSRAELLGQSAEMLVPERFRNRHRLLRAAYATAPAAQTLGSEDALLGLRKDGSEFPVEISLSPLETEDGILISSSIRDVSERRRAEETLRLRERALDSVSQGIIITDPSKPDNPVLYANPAFERLTGYSQAEVVGRNCRFLQGEGTDPAAVAEVRRAVREGRACSLELLNYRKDHTAFWNALSVSPVRDADGKLTHFVGVQTDVTERRKLEEQYRQAQKMEVVGRLAGGVAHDFNNLLTVINGYGELVLATLPSNVPARDLVGEMVKSGERAAALTRQLLAFSRQQMLAPRVLNLNSVIIEMEKMLRRVIGEDIELATRLEPTLAPVRADPGQLEQVLLNLAVNARDAMPQGGKLTLETRDVELEDNRASASAALPAGRYALLAVSDTGLGMTPEVRARVFEPFFTTKGPGKGTGLGLATVHGIVTQSGGRIEVYSEVGHGTTFKVYLPHFTGPAPGGRRSHTGTAAAPRGCETILLAEDEESVRALGRQVLRECGYAVIEAAGGEQALSLCEREAGDIHLLVSDVVMPGMGGRELAERLLAARPGMRVLYLSGYADDAVIRHGVLEADVNFLQKPFSAGALARKVREVLDA